MTIGLFIADIFTMVLNLFILFGIGIASLLIWLVGEEEFDGEVPMMQPEQNANIASIAIYSIFIMLPFFISIAFQYLNFFLITLDNRDEIYWYLGNKNRGMKIINGSFIFSLIALILILIMYFASWSRPSNEVYSIEYKQLLAKFFAFLQVTVVKMLA